MTNNSAPLIDNEELSATHNAAPPIDNENIVLNTMNENEMERRTKEKDWEHTPSLGPMSKWPQSLLTSLSILLASKFPIILFWGKEYRCFYNDAYIPILGAKHPRVFGAPCRETWSEIWDFVGPMFERVTKTKIAHWSEDLLMTMTRNGYEEECYFTFSYGPVATENGSVGGIFAPVTETTDRVLAERRMHTMRLLSVRTADKKSVDDVVNATMGVFSEEDADISFAFCYLLEGGKARSRGATDGFPRTRLPSEIALENNAHEDVWGLRKTLLSGNSSVLDIRGEQFGQLPGGRSNRKPETAAIIPLHSSSNGSVTGVLCLGINPMKRLSNEYQSFIDLVGGHLSKSIQSAEVYEQELARAKALEELDRAKTNFFQNISHEFRTPIHLTLANIQDILENNELSSEAQSKLAMAHRNSLRLLKLVNSLLEFSRIEANRHQANFTEVDIADFSRNIASMFQSAFDAANVGFVIAVGAFEPKTVYLDPDMWEKIILNLISNAFKFTLKGRVVVELHQEDAFAVLRVADSGIGIAPEHLSTLFKRFHRVEGAQGRSFEGSGIGCSLVAELTHLLSGTVDVTSKLGQGTTFIVRIPLKEEPPSDASDIPKPSSGEVSKPSLHSQAFVEEAKRWLPESNPALTDVTAARSQRNGDSQFLRGQILLADDNSDMQRYISSILSPHFTLIVKSNGQEAYDYLSDEMTPLPDLIVTDIMMPEMNGLELLRHIRGGIHKRKTQHLPVILLSARAGEEARLNGLQNGANDYLIKPFSKKELLARVYFHLTEGLARERLEQQVLIQTKEIREREQRYKELVEHIPGGVFRMDSKGRLEFVNSTWRELLMFGEDEDPNEWVPIVHPDDTERVQEFLRLGLEDHQPASLDEHRIIRHDGSMVYLTSRQIPTFREESGEFTGILGVSTDITKLKTLEYQNLQAIQRVEGEQRKRAEDAEENRKKLQTFVDVISHEVRNPISNILNMLEMLKSSSLDISSRLNSFRLQSSDDRKNLASVRQMLFTQEQYLEAIELCAAHQRVIADDVLELSRLQSEHIVVSREPFQPRELLKDCFKIFDTMLRTKHIAQLSYAPPEDDHDRMTIPTYVDGDSKRLRQILINLISNAIKFMERVSTKSLSLTLAGEWIDEDCIDLKFLVKDSGIGMSPEEQAQLFKPFTQANMKTYRDYGGSGMGLYICRLLVESLGGSINVESKEGVGTLFTFTARCYRSQCLSAQQNEAASTSASVEEYDLTSTRILIVDDNSLNQKILDRQLQGVKAETSIAENGYKAVQLIKENQSDPAQRFDVVLLDVEMPVMNGIEAIQEIRKWEALNHLSPLPVIGLSANARDAHKDEALSAGMNDYVTKPYRRRELIAKITQYVCKN